MTVAQSSTPRVSVGTNIECYINSWAKSSNHTDKIVGRQDIDSDELSICLPWTDDEDTP